MCLVVSVENEVKKVQRRVKEVEDVGIKNRGSLELSSRGVTYWSGF